MSIRINDLTVRFKNGVVAVNKASLEIPKGIYGLLGENGAGVGTIEVNKLIPSVPRIVFIKNVFPILNHAINKIGMLSSK